MQIHSELDVPAARVEAAAASSRRRKSVPRRKVTIRISETLHQQLETATIRPGVGKSSMIETALEQFLEPKPSIEDTAQARFDVLDRRFDQFERDMRMMAETIALHARYNLAVLPPVPQSREREAVLLGDKRFKILAEQVERRLRLGRPLMQETIDRLGFTGRGAQAPGPGEALKCGTSASNNGAAASASAEQPLPAAARMGGSPSRLADSSVPAAGKEGPNPSPEQAGSGSGSSEEAETSHERQFSQWRLILSVFLPFAAGYYLAYLFRTINASISPALASTFGLDAADTGLLASVYFLIFGLAQIPLGVLLDRFGPRRVQGVLLIIAAGGASLFGAASSFPELIVGRAMIGLGVAGSLMAGLKAVVIWFPRERVALFNGWMIMLGSLGAVTATAPAEWLLTIMGWRDLFGIITMFTVAVSALIYLIVPERAARRAAEPDRKPLTLRSIFMDARFLRVAPLSAACIGSSWALHSLWASAWLADVEGLDHQTRASEMCFMAIGLSLGALLLGTIADRLRKQKVTAEVLLAGVAAIYFVAQLALILRLPLPSLLPWSVVSIAGAATVLSFAAIADYFPSAVTARAIGALNLLHFGFAFAVQYGVGFVVSRWQVIDGHYPTVAYQYAFSLSLALQAVGLIWFAMPWFMNLNRRLRGAVIRQDEKQDSRTGVFPVAEQGPLLEAQDSMEW
jgi:MFS family permease